MSFSPHGMLDPWARRNSAWKKSLFAAFVETEHLTNARCLRATAEMEASHFREMHLRAPIAIVPNAVSISVLQPRPVRQRMQALFLSRIHPKKGLDLLLKAWAKVEDEHPEWDLVIAGIDENGHETELKKQAERLSLDRVTFFWSCTWRCKRSSLSRIRSLYFTYSRREFWACDRRSACSGGASDNYNECSLVRTGR